MHLTAYAVTYKCYRGSIRGQQKSYDNDNSLLKDNRVLKILPSLVTPKILSMAAEPDELGSNSLWLSPIT